MLEQVDTVYLVPFKIECGEPTPRASSWVPRNFSSDIDVRIKV